jgi:hypothetical protein
VRAGEDAVPLSEHEQRLFEQIERSLAEDTKFASAVRSTDPRFHARRRVVLAVILLLIGLGVLVFGVIKIAALGVLGFVIMLGATVFGIQSFRRGRQPDLKLAAGTATGKGTRRATSKGTRRIGLVARLEERWRNRPDQIS